MFKIFDADGTTPGLIYAQAHLGGAQRTFGGSFILEANQDYLAIARQKNGVSQDLWVNGVQDPIITNISGNAVAYSFYGRISTNTSQPLYLSVVWNRYLSDREVQSVSRNPWQVFKRPSTTIWTPA